MISLANSKLLDILPPNLRSDPDIVAASKAVDKEFSSVINSIKNVLTVADISNASSDIVDHIIVESNVDFYDSSLDIEIRREIARKAIELNIEKGTPAAVEKLASTLFAESRVEEWFEYGGNPYMFKIITTDRITDTEKISRITMAVDSVKNRRSHLERFAFQRDNHMDKYYGGAVSISSVHTIKAEV